jgi:cytochrome d ubiquinol oxidase subunit I
MLGVALLGVFLFWRRRRFPDDRWYLWLLIVSAPLGFVAIEAGWTVTEVGRQPWIIYGIMRTSEAVTPVPNLIVPFTMFTALYIVLFIIVIYLLWRHVFQSPTGEALEDIEQEGPPENEDT